VVYYVKKPIRVEYYPKTEEIIDNIEDIKTEEELQPRLAEELKEELQLELKEEFKNEELQLKLEELEVELPLELEEENDMLME